MSLGSSQTVPQPLLRAAAHIISEFRRSNTSCLSSTGPAPVASLDGSAFIPHFITAGNAITPFFENTLLGKVCSHGSRVSSRHHVLAVCMWTFQPSILPRPRLANLPGEGDLALFLLKQLPGGSHISSDASNLANACKSGWIAGIQLKCLLRSSPLARSMNPSLFHKPPMTAKRPNFLDQQTNPAGKAYAPITVSFIETCEWPKPATGGADWVPDSELCFLGMLELPESSLHCHHERIGTSVIST